jgi:DnaJ family protein A protein 2
MDYYQILEIEKTASHDEIKKAFRKKAVIHHPDKGGDPEMFKKINTAYETLSDPEKRKTYDNPPQNTFSEFNTFNHQPNFNIHNIFANFTMNSQALSPDIIHNTNITLEDICQKKVKKFRINRTITCNCYQNAKICHVCNGRGRMIKNIFTGVSTCDKCKGSGKIVDCEICNNFQLEDTAIIAINLDSSIHDGYKYVSNEGHSLPNTLQGKIIINLKYTLSDTFQVYGRNLAMRYTLSLKDALLGHSCEIKHPSGKILVYKTQDITKPETVRTISSGGLDDESYLEVRYTIVFPDKIDDEKKKELLKIL